MFTLQVSMNLMFTVHCWLWAPKGIVYFSFPIHLAQLVLGPITKVFGTELLFIQPIQQTNQLLR